MIDARGNMVLPGFQDTHLHVPEAGIGPDDPDPQGGIYGRDPETGRLNGLLLENAQQRIRNAAPDDEVVHEGLLVALDEPAKSAPPCASCGRRRARRRTGVPAGFVPVGHTPELDPERRAVLVRAVDEALLNVEKYARARSVVVTLAAYDGRVGDEAKSTRMPPQACDVSPDR